MLATSLVGRAAGRVTSGPSAPAPVGRRSPSPCASGLARLVLLWSALFLARRLSPLSPVGQSFAAGAGSGPGGMPPLCPGCFFLAFASFCAPASRSFVSLGAPRHSGGGRDWSRPRARGSWSVRVCVSWIGWWDSRASAALCLRSSSRSLLWASMASPVRAFSGHARLLSSAPGAALSPTSGHRGAPTATPMGGGASLRRFLKPTTHNFLVWLLLVALVCVMAAILHTQRQLLEHEASQGRETGDSSRQGRGSQRRHD